MKQKLTALSSQLFSRLVRGSRWCRWWGCADCHEEPSKGSTSYDARHLSKSLSYESRSTYPLNTLLATLCKSSRLCCYGLPGSPLRRRLVVQRAARGHTSRIVASEEVARGRPVTKITFSSPSSQLEVPRIQWLAFRDRPPFPHCLKRKERSPIPARLLVSPVHHHFAVPAAGPPCVPQLILHPPACPRAVASRRCILTHLFQSAQLFCLSAQTLPTYLGNRSLGAQTFCLCVICHFFVPPARARRCFFRASMALHVESGNYPPILLMMGWL